MAASAAAAKAIRSDRTALEPVMRCYAKERAALDFVPVVKPAGRAYSLSITRSFPTSVR